MTDIGAARSYFDLCFLCSFLSTSAWQDLEMGPCFWYSSHGFERSCYFRAKSLAKNHVSVVFLVIDVDVGYGRWASSGTHFAALAVVEVLSTRAGLRVTSFL